MVQVEVSEGILEGEEVVNEIYPEKKFFSFKGVPFAEPPVGDLRFKAPQPCKPWTGVRSAKEHSAMCYQFDYFRYYKPGGSEDCLYLNVYTPSINPPQPLPVMFWIHGGGFVSGFGDDSWYGPEYLLNKDVVLVTCNYRLEVLGFLCLDTEDVPGNAGMKDQVAALRWVSKNIQSFGGDPNNITIFGESAGGASVGYHLVSPMSKGLFKRAILQSGVQTCWFSYVTDARERGLALARKLGCRSDDDKEIYEYLKSVPVESLIMHSLSVPITFSEKEKGRPSFIVVDEKKFGDNERFYYGDFSYEHLTNIHEGVEVFLGVTQDEGLLLLSVPGSLQEQHLNRMTNFYEEFLPRHIADASLISDQLKAGKAIKEFHFNKKEIVVEDWENVVKFISACFFHYATITLAKMLAFKKKNNVFLYQFSCLSKRNQFVKFYRLQDLVKNKPVVPHCDDLLYIFNGKSFSDHNNDPEVLKLVDKVTSLWTNFAKYGNPTPDESLGVTWPAYTLEKQEYLDIGNELIVRQALHQAEIKLWESVYKKYAPEFATKFETDIILEVNETNVKKIRANFEKLAHKR